MPLLSGKTGLVVGIANDRSYAWHISKALIENGAKCAFTHLPGERNEHRTRRGIEALGVTSPWLQPLDAGDDAQLDSGVQEDAESFQRLHCVIHSIAF